jgi:hypothetical protein
MRQSKDITAHIEDERLYSNNRGKELTLQSS